MAAVTEVAARLGWGTDGLDTSSVAHRPISLSRCTAGRYLRPRTRPPYPLRHQPVPSRRRQALLDDPHLLRHRPAPAPADLHHLEARDLSREPIGSHKRKLLPRAPLTRRSLVEGYIDLARLGCSSRASRSKALMRSRSSARGADVLVTLGLASPAAQRVRRVSDLRQYRADRRPLRGVLASILEHHLHGTTARISGEYLVCLVVAPSSQAL